MRLELNNGRLYKPAIDTLLISAATIESSRDACDVKRFMLWRVRNVTSGAHRFVSWSLPLQWTATRRRHASWVCAGATRWRHARECRETRRELWSRRLVRHRSRRFSQRSERNTIKNVYQNIIYLTLKHIFIPLSRTFLIGIYKFHTKKSNLRTISKKAEFSNQAKKNCTRTKLFGENDGDFRVSWVCCRVTWRVCWWWYSLCIQTHSRFTLRRNTNDTNKRTSKNNRDKPNAHAFCKQLVPQSLPKGTFKARQVAPKTENHSFAPDLAVKHRKHDPCPWPNLPSLIWPGLETGKQFYEMQAPFTCYNYLTLC